MPGNSKNDEIEVCESKVIHKEVVDKVSQRMPPWENFYELAGLFKVFGDSTRIKILYALLDTEMCVCDLAVLLNMNQSAISHQLRILKQAGLVKARREGKVVYYSSDCEYVNRIIDEGYKHIFR